VQHHGWAAFVLLTCALFALLPIAAKIVDYGAEGWLWALFGLYQRMYVDGSSAAGVDGAAQSAAPRAHAMTDECRPRVDPRSVSTPDQVRGRPFPKNALMRLLACCVAALVYIWQEQREYSFPQVHFAVFVLGVGVLSLGLCLFRRGRSRIQPPETIAGALRFIGRHTLEIYAVQLAGSELIVKLAPDLAP
jgi:hypothetical protein